MLKMLQEQLVKITLKISPFHAQFMVLKVNVKMSRVVPTIANGVQMLV